MSNKSKPPSPLASPLSRRERQIMDIVYSRGSATAAEIHAALPDPPSYSAVRALLRILEEKGQLQHQQDGLRYVFSPITPREEARRSALRHVVETFFDDSAAQAMAALLDVSKDRLRPEELAHLRALIDQAKKEGR